jgi:hypothetical protein
VDVVEEKDAIRIYQFLIEVEAEDVLKVTEVTGNVLKVTEVTGKVLKRSGGDRGGRSCGRVSQHSNSDSPPWP